VTVTSNLKKTPFYDKHVGLGAQMASFGGYIMPIRYEGIIREHLAAREHAVLFDTCHMGEFRVGGGYAVADLENLLTCDISSMCVGQCRYGLMCNDNGGVIDDLLIYRIAHSDFMLVVNSATQDSDCEWIKAHVTSGTAVENVSGETAKVDLQGPNSPKIMQQQMGEPIRDIRFCRFKLNRYRDQEVLISRTGYTGEIGFEIYCDRESALQFWNDSMELGAVPAGLGARDTLRLEMGMPLNGHEFDEKRNAAESGFTRAISQTKQFIGSDVVLDKSRRRWVLVAIEFEGRRAARHGDSIDDCTGRREIGVITSGSFAPSLGKAIAMGYVEKDSGTTGSRVLVQAARKRLPGVICDLPFYKRATARKSISEFL